MQQIEELGSLARRFEENLLCRARWRPPPLLDQMPSTRDPRELNVPKRVFICAIASGALFGFLWHSKVLALGVGSISLHLTRHSFRSTPN